MEGSNIDQSLLYEENVNEQEDESQEWEEEQNRRIQIENLIKSGKLDGILDDDDSCYSEEDQASEEEEPNSSVTNRARLPAGANDHFAQTINFGHMPAIYAPYTSVPLFFTPTRNRIAPLQIHGTAIEPLENGRQYQPSLPAIADQTIEQQISDGAEYVDTPIDRQFMTLRNSVQPVHQFALSHTLQEGEAGWAIKYEELYKAYSKLEILYKTRGSKLEETANSAVVIQEELFRQMQAMNHLLNLADKQCEDLIKQNEELNEKHKDNEKRLQETETANGELVRKNTALEAKLVELEQSLKKSIELSKQPNQQSDATIGILSKELERAIEGLAKKRTECTSIRAQLGSSSKRVAELEQLKEQLEKDNQELADELKDTKTWLDRQLAEQEKHQSSQANLQNMDLIVEENERNLQALKNQNKDLNFELEALRAFKVNKEVADNQLFMQINDLNLRITAQQTENEKIKAMYLDVYNEKANLENSQLKMKMSADDQKIEQLTIRCQELEQMVKQSELGKQPNQQSEFTYKAIKEAVDQCMSEHFEKLQLAMLDAMSCKTTSFTDRKFKDHSRQPGRRKSLNVLAQKLRERDQQDLLLREQINQLSNQEM